MAIIGIKQNHIMFSLFIDFHIASMINTYDNDHNPSGRLYFTKSEGVYIDIDCLRFSTKLFRYNASAHRNNINDLERNEK